MKSGGARTSQSEGASSRRRSAAVHNRGWRSSWAGARSATSALAKSEKNAAPSQWGRRLARLVGAKYGVKMSPNFSKNEGSYRGRDIVIKCAKSSTPPVSILLDMLDRIDTLWAVYVTHDGGAEVYALDIRQVRQIGYFTRGPNVQKRVEIYLRKLKPMATIVGSLSAEEVDSCRIP